jgi:hypothetical protein
MPRPRKIDDVRFARLWLEGVAARDIARAFDVSRHSVSAARLRLNLPARRPEGDLRDRGLGPLSRHAGTFARLTVPEEVIAAAYGLRAEQVRAVMSGSGASDGLAGEEQRGTARIPGREIWTRDRDARLLDLPPPGRYRDFARLAEVWGLPLREVQARWHRVRAGA